MTNSVSANAIAIFVRNPVPGRVKTRLARDLGDVAACGLYQAMVADCIGNAATTGMPLYLFHDGQNEAGLPHSWMTVATDVMAQVGESLGERMTEAFLTLYGKGFENVVLTGSDIPGIDADLLQTAIAGLDDNDVVFSPALDGGYCLVAVQKKTFTTQIFQDIPWSTCDVMAATRSACRDAGLRMTLLDSRQDIDTLDDLKAYCLNPSLSAGSTNSWLATHQFLSLPR